MRLVDVPHPRHKGRQFKLLSAFQGGNDGRTPSATQNRSLCSAIPQGPRIACTFEEDVAH
eukprot:scaffold86_cov338-Pavlova_lutheri.AAC.62